MNKKLNHNDRAVDSSALSESVPYLVYRATNALTEHLRLSLRPLQITISEWRILSSLHVKGDITVQELTDCTGMKQPVVSKTISKMVKLGLIHRCSDANDYRYVYVTLTSKGESLIEKILPVSSNHDDLATRDFSDNEIKFIKKLLRQIYNNMNAGH